MYGRLGGGGLPDEIGFAFTKSFLTNDRDELSNATPPITTSFVPSAVLEFAIDDPDALAPPVLKSNVDDDGGFTEAVELEVVGAEVLDCVRFVVSSPGRTYLLLANRVAPPPRPA